MKPIAWTGTIIVQHIRARICEESIVNEDGIEVCCAKINFLNANNANFLNANKKVCESKVTVVS